MLEANGDGAVFASKRIRRRVSWLFHSARPATGFAIKKARAIGAIDVGKIDASTSRRPPCPPDRVDHARGGPGGRVRCDRLTGAVAHRRDRFIVGGKIPLESRR